MSFFQIEEVTAVRTPEDIAAFLDRMAKQLNLCRGEVPEHVGSALNRVANSLQVAIFEVQEWQDGHSVKYA